MRLLIRTPRTLVLALVTLAGCPWLGAEDEAARLDPDDDGIPWPRDCDSTDPEIGGATPWYADADGDDHGDATTTQDACEAPDGYVASDDDCDDGEARAHPDHAEVCNDRIDNDCVPGPGTCVILDHTLPDDAWLTLTGEADSLTGFSLAAGDVTGDGVADLVVGAPDLTVGLLQPGGAWLVPGPLTPTTVLADADRYTGPSDSGLAGLSVTLLADVSGAGLGSALAIGAPGDDAVSNNEGRVVVFDAPVPSGPLTLTNADAVLTGTQANASFGWSTVGLGDVDRNGRADVAVGAFNHDGSVTNGGAVFVFRGPLATATADTAATATVTGDRPGGALGFSLAAGDLDGAPGKELVVSAPFGMDSATDTGEVFVFAGTITGAVTPADALATLVGAVGDDFGWALAVADLDGDGSDDLAVGAPGALLGGTDTRGAVYVFLGPLAGAYGPADADAVIAGDPDSTFGTALGRVPDLDGDGREGLLGWAAEAAAGDGQLFLFNGPLSGDLAWVDADATFGPVPPWFISVGLGAADLDDDGYPDLALGSPTFAPSEDTAGAVHVVHGVGP